MEGAMGVAWLLQAAGRGGDTGGQPPVAQWLVLGVLALIALYLLTAAVRCALRLLGLAVLLGGAWLAWRWLA
jgi:hypothetical protein